MQFGVWGQPQANTRRQSTIKSQEILHDSGGLQVLTSLPFDSGVYMEFPAEVRRETGCGGLTPSWRAPAPSTWFSSLEGRGSVLTEINLHM